MALPRNDMPMPDLSQKFSSPLPDGLFTRAFSTPLTTPLTLVLPKHKISSEGNALVESLPPEMVAELQAYWVKRIEEMADRLMTGGGVPDRRHSPMYPNGDA